MTVRLLLGVALVANVLVLVLCTGKSTQYTATSISSASTSSSSSSSHAFSRSSSKSVGMSKPKKCRKVKKCPKNEEFSFCPQSLQRAQNCSEKAEPSTYRAESDKPCKEGCVCKESYLRAENGTCIPAGQCPLTCGANEVLDDCPTTCDSDYCPIDEEDTLAKPCVAPEKCPPPICKCAFNHRRAVNGTCIPTRECPCIDCSSGPNQEYNTCPPLCPTDDCSQASPTGECPPHFGNILIILPCNPKCRCIKDYWRLDGICVPYGQCPGVCPDNERYSTCIQAECRGLNCTQKDKPVPCIRMDPQYCRKGCVCQEGYLRNKDGVCILEDKCEPTCADNEEFVQCMQGVCRAKNCSERGQDVPCPDLSAEQCDSGCICKEGFLRAEDGTCVPEEQCKPCCENEVLDDCPMMCNTDYCPLSDGEEQVCTQADPCVPACKCKFNYKRAINGTCIPTINCPEFDCPKRNEEYIPCPPYCPTDECGKPRLDGICPFKIGVVLHCQPKCQCKDGYGRTNGTCVPLGECPDICPPNEMYSPCVQQTCRPQNCSYRDLAMETCPTCDAAECQRGCVCKENYYRNDQGDCISYEECEAPFECNKRNEEFVSCPPICPTDECGKPRLTGRCPFRIGIILQCKPKCQCKDGYGRTNGTCVPLGECPNICPPNEVYSPCVQQTCRPQNCSYRDLAMETCPTCDAAECQRGCVCQENYYRNDKGDCISYEECGGPMCPNAHEVFDPYFTKCPSNTCESLTEKYACDENQEVGPGCRCESGYLRSKLNEPCIPICDCDEMKDSPECPK